MRVSHPPPSAFAAATLRRSSANAPPRAGAAQWKVAVSAPVGRARHPLELALREPDRAAGTLTPCRLLDRRGKYAKTRHPHPLKSRTARRDWMNVASHAPVCVAYHDATPIKRRNARLQGNGGWR
jgi:hypothetical protein